MNKNWFTSMFSNAAKAQDTIKSGALNASKILAIFGVTSTTLLAFSKRIFGAKGPFWSLTPGQMLTLWLSMLGFLTVVFIFDVSVREYVTAHVTAAEENAPVVWFNPTRRAKSPVAGGDPGGLVVALRRSGDDESGIQYLVIRDQTPGDPADATNKTAWVGASLLLLH
jgi:hypothetical protein